MGRHDMEYTSAIIDVDVIGPEPAAATEVVLTKLEETHR